LAFTSTRPYLNEKELTVRIRAAIAGLMVLPPPREQP
jgi:hypothetical protein